MVRTFLDFALFSVFMKTIQKCDSYFEAESLGNSFHRVIFQLGKVMTSYIQRGSCLRLCGTAISLFSICLDASCVLAPCLWLWLKDSETKEVASFKIKVKSKEQGGFQLYIFTIINNIVITAAFCRLIPFFTISDLVICTVVQ